MIALHRLGHNAESFLLNPDLIVTVEATPDTVVTLTTGTRFVVVEPPERVADEVRAWRVAILREALDGRPVEAVPQRSAMAAAVSARQAERAGERPLTAVVDPRAGAPTEGSARPADYPER